jgi:hypothetical protein
MFRLYSDLIAEMQGLEPEHFHVIRPVTKIVTKLVPHSRNLLRHKKALERCSLASTAAPGAVRVQPGRFLCRVGHSLAPRPRSFLSIGCPLNGQVRSCPFEPCDPEPEIGQT